MSPQRWVSYGTHYMMDFSSSEWLHCPRESCWRLGTLGTGHLTPEASWEPCPWMSPFWRPRGMSAQLWGWLCVKELKQRCPAPGRANCLAFTLYSFSCKWNLLGASGSCVSPWCADWAVQKLLLVPLGLRALPMESGKCVVVRCLKSLLHGLCSAPGLSGKPPNF